MTPEQYAEEMAEHIAELLTMPGWDKLKELVRARRTRMAEQVLVNKALSLEDLRFAQGAAYGEAELLRAAEAMVNGLIDKRVREREALRSKAETVEMATMSASTIEPDV